MKAALGIASVWLLGVGTLAWVVSWGIGGGYGGGTAEGIKVWTFDAGSKYPSVVDGERVETELAPLRISEVRAGARGQAHRAGNGIGGKGAEEGKGTSHLIETELSTAGKYLGAESMFYPLADLIQGSELKGKLLAARVASWSDEMGQVYFLPRDVHPVTLTYRWDLWQAAGVEVEKLRTWDEFIEACARYESFYRKAPAEWPEGNASLVLLMLQQQGITLEDGRIDRPEILKVLRWYAKAGQRFERYVGRSVEQIAVDLEGGEVGAVLTPDWRWGQIRKLVPGLSGKLKMRGLPMFADGDAPTGTWGGTGVGIPRDTPNLAKSIRVLEALYSDRELAVRRFEETGIFPVMPAVWDDPRVTSADVYFSGQRIGVLLAELAPKIRSVRVTRLTPVVQMEMNGLVRVAVNDPEKLDEAVRASSERIEGGRR